MNINADGYRLPTEMEWEFAARGGNQSQNYIYSGSFNIWEVAWFTYNSNNTTHKIGTKIPNEQGLYDMSGNVWEWCWDWYDPYPIGSYINPTGPGGGDLRIGRGGGWSAQAQYCQISNRPISYPFCRDNSIGFRVVRRIQ
jgi:formylglycine-generating enzyme required for sulfatase activity